MAIDKLRRDLEMLVIADTPKARVGVHKAMQSFGATYLWWFMPRPYEKKIFTILLPKAEPRSVKVATVLHDAAFFDLGAHLRQLALRSRLNERCPNSLAT